jgi:putative membrane protein
MQWWCSALGIPWEWTWRAYPGVWLFIFLLFALYRRILRRADQVAPDAPGRRGRTISFGIGLVSLWLALDWPIGALGAGYLASAHMVQFLLIGLIVPPLLLYGIPPVAYEPLRRRPALLRVLGFLTHPLIAIVIFNGVVLGTHTPMVADALMKSQLGSAAIDLAWLGSAFIFWWPLIAPLPERRWMHPLVKTAILTAQLIVGKPIFVYLTFAEYPVYATYELAPRVNGMTAQADQQIAGLLMEVAGAFILLAATTILFLSWAKREERADRRAEPARSSAA